MNCRRLFLSVVLVVFVCSVSVASELPDWATTVGAQSKPIGSFIINATSLGAKNDGKTISTVQIQSAIDACVAKGGGKVVFDKGVYLTGALFVKHNVELHIGEGVTLQAVSNVADFPIIKTRVAGIEMEWPAAIIQCDQPGKRIGYR